jgi:hypothetical protein
MGRLSFMDTQEDFVAFRGRNRFRLVSIVFARERSVRPRKSHWRELGEDAKALLYAVEPCAT